MNKALTKPLLLEYDVIDRTAKSLLAALNNFANEKGIVSKNVVSLLFYIDEIDDLKVMFLGEMQIRSLKSNQVLFKISELDTWYETLKYCCAALKYCTDGLYADLPLNISIGFERAFIKKDGIIKITKPSFMAERWFNSIFTSNGRYYKALEKFETSLERKAQTSVRIHDALKREKQHILFSSPNYIASFKTKRRQAWINDEASMDLYGWLDIKAIDIHQDFNKLQQSINQDSLKGILQDLEQAAKDGENGAFLTRYNGRYMSVLRIYPPWKAYSN